MPVYKIEISKCFKIERIERSNGQISEYHNNEMFLYRNIRMQGAKFARHTTGFPREKAAQLGQGSREVDIQDAQKKIFKMLKRKYLRCSKTKNKTKGPRQVRELVLRDLRFLVNGRKQLLFESFFRMNVCLCQTEIMQNQFRK